VAEPLHARRQLAPPFFPFGKSEQLLFESGFRVQKDGLFWEQYNLRDYLIAFLCRYGGLRASEPHHLFVNDVRVRYDDVGRPSAEVLLYHPTDSQITYMDPVTKRLATVTREEYLKRRFSMRARNMMTDRLHAGWKDLLLDNAELYARVQWFPSEAGAVFWKTWRRYLDHVRRPQQPSHPWAFCAASGSPSTTVQFGRAFERAVGRIKLIAKKELGTTPHGLRHAYGQSLRKANVPRKIIQLAMHHRNPFSQDVYTEPSIVEVNATLNDATIRLHLASYGLGGSAWESRA
jgi:integrase